MKDKIGNHKVLIYALIFLLSIAIIIFFNILSFSQVQITIYDQVEKSQLTETEFAAKQFENHVTQVKNGLITLTKFPLTEDLKGCDGNLKQIHEKTKTKSQAILRVNDKGDITECSSQEYSNFLQLNIKNKNYFINPKESNEPFISEVIIQGDKKQIFVSVPLYETTEYTPYPNFKGEFKGVLLSIIELDLLKNLYFHKFFDTSNNKFILINSETKETILKSNNFPEFDDIKTKISNKNLHTSSFLDYGQTIQTSSDLFLSGDKWTLYVFSPLKNHSNEIKKLKKRHFYSLGFVLIGIISIFIILVKVHKSKEEVQEKLNKLGIKIGLEKNKFTTSDIKLENQKMYLIKEEDDNNCFDIFISALNKGYAGLGIIREDPNKVKEKYNLKETSFIWLSKNNTDTPSETNINTLIELIKEFILKSEKSVILIENLNYLFTQNTFDDMKSTIHSLKDLISQNNCIIILSINTSITKDEEFSLINSEAIDLYGKHLSNNVNLSEMELEILNLVNINNNMNKIISFKDITNKFNITKPTTRTKVKRLQALGLINIELKGRVKCIKITSIGRKIIK